MTFLENVILNCILSLPNDRDLEAQFSLNFHTRQPPSSNVPRPYDRSIERRASRVITAFNYVFNYEHGSDANRQGRSAA